MATPAQQPRAIFGRHPADPANLHAAAQVLGRMVGDDALSDEDAYEAIQIFAREALGSIDKSGLQARLCWTLAGAAEARRKQREDAERAARNAAQPLIEQSASPASILTAARKAAHRAAAGLLGDDAIREILRAEWNCIHGRFRRR